MAHIDECGHCHEVEQKHITAAKHDLAVKVQRAISELRIDTRFDSQWRNGFQQCKGDALRALVEMFTTEGVILEGRGDDET